ncbi:hypothetical protein [Adhaeribacter radiodurans]|uniref:Uncharacterized protein n=1 Tax=Adhaeribacter radiodurans TaxID=2745197 RepID=A0A7L7L862_9BACT|nr:hypothetical protein [Adhaeribacter radiodurans]QMU28987.1 hypothetical protein HUW48_13470 [Adhaeribacter radiodurans]
MAGGPSLAIALSYLALTIKGKRFSKYASSRKCYFAEHLGIRTRVSLPTDVKGLEFRQ